MVEDAMAGKIQLAPFVTHTIPRKKINEAFDLMHEGKSIPLGGGSVSGLTQALQNKSTLRLLDKHSTV